METKTAKCADRTRQRIRSAEETTSGGAEPAQSNRMPNPTRINTESIRTKRLSPKRQSSQNHKSFVVRSHCKCQQGQASQQNTWASISLNGLRLIQTWAGVTGEEQSGSPSDNTRTEELFRQADDEQNAERSEQDVEEKNPLKAPELETDRQPKRVKVEVLWQEFTLSSICEVEPR